ncbi:MAG: phosphoribosyltransferase family protein [Brevinematia bacterium]
MLIRNYCLLCGNITHMIVCDNCIKEIKPLSIHKNRCKKCSKPIIENDIDYCENCKDKNFYFSQNISLFSYHDPVIKNLVKIFKFDGIKKAGILLARIIENDFFNTIKNIEYDLITFVPSSKDSLKERGFNPVEFILKKLKINTINILEREKHLKKQSELSLTEREKFIKGQFYINKNWLLNGKKILIIDDIFTTGNTLNEISRILIENKAININTLTFFRD